MKMIFTMKRKAGTTREAFRAYYEGHHVPLVHRTIPMPDTYRRNYLTGDEVEFDVVTEMVFASEADAAAAGAIMGRPEVAAMIREDEDRFIEPGSVRTYIVDPCQSPG